MKGMLRIMTDAQMKAAAREAAPGVVDELCKHVDETEDPIPQDDLLRKVELLIERQFRAAATKFCTRFLRKKRRVR